MGDQIWKISIQETILWHQILELKKMPCDHHLGKITGKMFNLFGNFSFFLYSKTSKISQFFSTTLLGGAKFHENKIVSPKEIERNFQNEKSYLLLFVFRFSWFFSVILHTKRGSTVCYPSHFTNGRHSRNSGPPSVGRRGLRRIFTAPYKYS